MTPAESMIGGDRSDSDTPAVPRQPLPLRESSASDCNSRFWTCSTAGKGGPKLSGQEQDDVVAKIGSVVKKRSSSPEKKLPSQDDDTPNTRGARVKKEMEVGSRLVAVATDTFFSCFFLLREPISPPECVCVVCFLPIHSGHQVRWT